jgi:hypothetical protein
VAGAFYPEDAAGVQAALDRLVPPGPGRPARAVVVPHAGWTYSGAVAGETYAAVAVPRLALLLGPDHAGTGPPGAVVRAGTWRLPGADLPVDRALAGALLDATGALEADPRPHRREHCLEVQLPFLHRRRPDLAFVPVLLSRVDPAFCREVGQAVGRVVAGWHEPVLVVDSTDFTHYEPEARARAQDRLAIDAILALDAARLWRVVEGHAISMCGLAPTLVLLEAAPALGVRQARLVRYATSADASGDRTRVVGYAGLVLA